MYKPLISIIIPTFNSEATLDIALKSILKQTYANFEILVLDSLSTDKTLEILKEYQTIFSNLKIISEDDKGIYDAMNKGITNAKGDWLYFMGSDDSLFEPTTLEKVLSVENIKDIDVVYGNVFSESKNGIYDGKFSYSKLTEKNICHQAIFFKKKVFKTIGNFNLKYLAQADWDHNIRWFYSSKISNMYINLVIANYAEGGYSSLHGDEIFRNEKYFLFVKKGVGKLPYIELLKMCNWSIKFTKKKKEYYKWFLLNILKLKLRVNNKLGKLFTKNEN